jgi:hypothetical protein
MGRRRDGVLAATVLLPSAAAVVVLDAPVTPVAVVAGGAGALAVEALLSARAARVRAVWERPDVQLVAVVAGLCLAAAGVALVGPVVATVLAAGLVAYLALLAVLTVLGR